MGFHFFCPSGHLLQADARHVGRAAVCPYCNTTLRIPPAKASSLAADTAVLGSEFEDDRRRPLGRDFDAVSRAEDESPLLDLASGKGVADDSPGEQASDHRFESGEAATTERKSGSAETFFGDRPPFQAAERQRPVHIPCPAGHVLETPQDMLGRDAMCPFCSQVFRLEFQNSLEYREEQQHRAAREAERAARFWLQWAVAAAIVTVGGLILLIVSASQR